MAANPNNYGLRPGAYSAFRASEGFVPDGKASAADWARAPKLPRFVDMNSGRPAPMDTTAAMLWDDKALYIAFWAAEPAVAATMTRRDELLFFENDLEVFIDGGDSYYELEFNALGTIYEVFYIWRDAYTRASRWDVPRFDVHNPRVHTFGGDYTPGPQTFWTGAHPRGKRWAFLDYDLPGLAVQVHVDGRVNDPSVIDRGWTAEVTIPWAGLADLANGRSLPPRKGDVWGIFTGRFQQIESRSAAGRVTAGWAPFPFGVADTHVPECFTQVSFVDTPPPLASDPDFEPT